MEFTNSHLLQRSEEIESRADSGEGVDPRDVFSAASRGTILLAEKDPAELRHLASILENMGFSVLTADDGRVALKKIREFSPLLVLSPLDLPGYDGYKLSQALREDKATEGIPFMFIVESGQLPDHVIGHETYAHDYIQKPISVPDFKFRINALLRLRQKDRGDRASLLAFDQNKENGVKVGIEDSNQTQPPEPKRELPVSTDPTAELFGSMQNLLKELGVCLGQLQRHLNSLDTAGSQVDEDRDRAVTEGEPSVGADRKTESQELRGDQHEEIPDGASSELASLMPSDERVSRIEAYRTEFQEKAKRGPVFKGRQSSIRDVDDIFALFFPRKQRLGRKGEFGGPSGGLGDGGHGASESKDDPFGFDPELLGILREATADPGPRAAESTGDSEKKSARSLYAEAEVWVETALKEAGTGKAPNLSEAREIVLKLLNQYRQGFELLLLATDREQAFSIARHCVNTSIISLALSRSLTDRPEGFGIRVGLAALLHELGVAKLPPELVYKEGELKGFEVDVLRRRPLFSAEQLEDAEAGYCWLAEVVAQAFERRDGSGGPLGLRGSQVVVEAQVLGLVDVFEASIHRRPYRDPRTGYEVLYELSNECNGAYSRDLVRALIEAVSVFPPNERLRLSTGEVVRVVAVNTDNLSRPVVEVLRDSSGSRLKEGTKIDLLEMPTVKIKEVIPVRRWKASLTG